MQRWNASVPQSYTRFEFDRYTASILCAAGQGSFPPLTIKTELLRSTCTAYRPRSTLTYVTGRVPKLWPDPLKVDPGRWYVAEGSAGAGTAAEAHSQFKFPVFQAGPRVCLGMQVGTITHPPQHTAH